jgi:hypothetical protein
MSDKPLPPTATQKRLAHPDFVPTFSLGALRDRLPVLFPVPQTVPPSPKRRYRSGYRYLGYAGLADPAVRVNWSAFEAGLRLVDFSPLRDYLAQGYFAPSARGQTPFDPVSLLLCYLLRRFLDCSWNTLAQLLAGEHGAGWRRLFGFHDDQTPSESGLRYFRDTVGETTLEELVCLFIDLLHAQGIAPEHSTFPGDPPDRGVSISHDLMLHAARSAMGCAHVTETCYQPAPRPCPAREAGQRGCACTDPACAKMCRRTTPRDREARLIHYDGHNKHADDAESTDEGRNVYGYASNPDRLVDDRFACAWTLRTGLHPANADERSLFPDSFAALRRRFPWLKIGEVLADAALGYQNCLDPIWHAGALRMVDIRAEKHDADPETQQRRGYNDTGYPLCAHGYVMRPNGHDYVRRRTKWCCDKVCLTPPADDSGQAPPEPVPECPYQADDHKHGQVVNVGRTLPDGSVRLAREIAYDSDAWHKRYGRRSLSESRNGSIEHQGLKRLPGCGLSRGRKETAMADLLESLETLGRLVLEATIAAAKAGAG